MIPLFDANPTRRTPFVTVAFITLNAAIFFWMAFFTNFKLTVFLYGTIPLEIARNVDIYPFIPVPVHLTLFTGMFMHADIFHLIGNMLYLWIFGNNVEDLFGHGRFMVFYLLCGVAAAMAQVMGTPDSAIPMVGASGAISGVLAAYLLAYPGVRVYTLFWFILFIRIIPVPAWLWIGIWFLLQIASAGNGGPVAWGAHIGGFLAGLALFPFFGKLPVARI